MLDFVDPVFRGKSGPVNRGWSELWARHGRGLFNVDCTAGDVMRSGAAGGVLYLQGGAPFGDSEQAEFVRLGVARGVAVVSVGLYLDAVSGGDGAGPVVAGVEYWRDSCDRVFSGLVVGPVARCMDCPAMLRQAQRFLASNRAVFLLKKDWRDCAAGDDLARRGA